MGRKDRERFQRLKDGNPDYVGYRGKETVTVQAPLPETETVVCSVCNRKRNVDSDSLPEDVSAFVCLRCQEDAESSAA
ncbi:MAG TPA: hypothetical protein EYM75_06405 [Dehalococcoidia bacterium]|nr:hypothetical protein [Dehalococcoidia bacterium]